LRAYYGGVAGRRPMGYGRREGDLQAAGYAPHQQVALLGVAL
jgi:hypothetical protein